MRLNSRQKPIVFQVTGSNVTGGGGVIRFIQVLSRFLNDEDFDVRIVHKEGITRYDPQFDRVSRESDAPKVIRGNSKLYTISHFPNPITIVKGIGGISRQLSGVHHRHILHIHDLSSSFIIALVMNWILGSQIIVHIHGHPLREQRMKIERQGIMTRILWWLTWIFHIFMIRLANNRKATFLVNNQEIMKFYTKLGLDRDRLEIVSSAINIENFSHELLEKTSARESLGLRESENCFLIGYIGRLTHVKNVNFLIDAVHRLMKNDNSIRLIIVGSGPLESSLERKVSELGLEDNISFLGNVPNAGKYLRAFDIIVLPSLSEGSSYVMIEALTAGVCIVASNIQANTEIIGDSECGILIDPHSLTSLENAVLKLKTDGELRRDMQIKSTIRARHFEEKTVFTPIIRLYLQ